LRGLALILPPILTVLILLYLWDLLNRKVGEPTNYLIRTIAAVFVQESRTERPESQQDQWVGLTRDRNGREIAPFVPRVDYELVHDKTHATDKIPQTVLGFQNPVLAFYERYIHYRYWEPYRLKYIGLVVAVVFVYFIGHFLATFIGNSLWRAAEHTVFRLPIVRAVYPTVKEVIDFFLSEQRREYNRVVAVEYPRRGIWSLGLVTGESFRDLERSTGRELLTIFIPYTPYSVTGYVITVPRAEVLDLNISVEDAIRFVMSGGVISPNGRNALPAQPSATLPTPPSAPVSAEAGQPHSASHPAVGNSPDLIGARSSHEPASHNPGSHGSRPIRVGTRGSQLARAQADWVLAQLRKLAPGRGVELVEIRTGGDRAAEARLREIGGEGLFTKEIQNALMANEVDIAVHSLKDLPTAAVPGLVVAAVPPRAPALDVLVSPQFRDWRSLPLGARVGTSSPRRRGQLLRLRGDLVIEEIRGNVPTRLKKIDELGLAAVVLAHAGLQRLGLEASVTHHFTADEMLPAPGQGALAIECRSDDCELLDLLRPLDDPATHFATAAERAVLATLRGGCHMPLGSYATAAADQLGLRAGVFATDGRRAVLDFIAGDVHHAESLGRELAERLLAAGAGGLS
jgi:hydroxymethylbilane synthase